MGITSHLTTTLLPSRKQAVIDWWAQEYYRVLDDWVAEGRFAGKDQDLMIDIFERHPDKFILLRSQGKEGGVRTNQIGKPLL